MTVKKCEHKFECSWFIKGITFEKCAAAIIQVATDELLQSNR